MSPHASQYRFLSLADEWRMEADDLPPLDLNRIADEHPALLSRSTGYMLERRWLLVRHAAGELIYDYEIARALTIHMTILDDVLSNHRDPRGPTP